MNKNDAVDLMMQFSDQREQYFHHTFDDMGKVTFSYDAILALSEQLKSEPTAPIGKPGESEADEDRASYSWLLQDIDIILDYAISDKEKLSMIEKRIRSAAQPLPATGTQDESGPAFMKVISDRINYFSNRHHKYEAKELHDALNVILRLVPPSSYASQSQQTGTQVDGYKSGLIIERAKDTVVKYKGLPYYDVICSICGKVYGDHKAQGNNCPKSPYGGKHPTEFLNTVFAFSPQPSPVREEAVGFAEWLHLNKCGVYQSPKGIMWKTTFGASMPTDELYALYLSNKQI